MDELKPVDPPTLISPVEGLTIDHSLAGRFAISARKLTKRQIFGIGLIIVIALAGCGGSSASSQGVAADCLSVDSSVGNAIMSGAELGTGAQFVRASAVKSPDFEKVYFIAVEFSATGVSNQVGVFASNALTDGGGIIMAVDGFAQQFTVWPDADKTQAAISGADASVATAKACLE